MFDLKLRPPEEDARAGSPQRSIRSEGSADFCVTRLDYGIDEIAPLVVGQKSAFHGIDGDFLEIIERQAERFLSRHEFLGHGRVAHQAVVGVEGNAKPFLIQNLERMFR